jgi:endo-1,4-beta-D-glucanase Y
MKRLCFCLLALLWAAAPVHAQDLAPAGTPGQTVYIPYPVHIQLDGTFDDWKGVPTQTVTTGPLPSKDPAEDGALTFALAADDDALYLRMSITDNHIITGQHGTDFWNEDSLEFFINASGDLSAVSYGPGIFQVNINPGDIGKAPDKLTLTGVNSSSATVRGVVVKTTDGWGFEAALPGLVKPAHGLEIGFQAQANGASSKDRDVQLTWRPDPNNEAWQKPGIFGSAIFYEVGRTDLPTPQPRTASAAPTAQPVDWKALVAERWELYKQSYIFCGEKCGNNAGLVFDPNIGYGAVSEGVGYGLLMAALMNDQPTFDAIFQAAERTMRESGSVLYNWKVDSSLKVVGSGSATDAEEDIALALIFAAHRVQAGAWKAPDGMSYADRAKAHLDAIYQTEVADGQYLLPGDTWGTNGRDIINLSYFAPAWYRIYDQFEGGTRWQKVLDQGYTSLLAVQKGAALGLAPDWSTADGQPAFAYCDAKGISRDGCKFDMTYDAIRVPWRVGLDCLWFSEARACDWSKRSARFLNGLKPDDLARMYTMDGTPIQYQNELTTGMWLVAAMASGDADLQSRLEGLLHGYLPGSSTQYYFNQSLAWFGAAVRSGDFRNLLEGTS